MGITRCSGNRRFVYVFCQTDLHAKCRLSSQQTVKQTFQFIETSMKWARKEFDSSAEIQIEFWNSMFSFAVSFAFSLCRAKRLICYCNDIRTIVTALCWGKSFAARFSPNEAKSEVNKPLETASSSGAYNFSSLHRPWFLRKLRTLSHKAAKSRDRVIETHEIKIANRDRNMEKWEERQRWKAKPSGVAKLCLRLPAKHAMPDQCRNDVWCDAIAISNGRWELKFLEYTVWSTTEWGMLELSRGVFI